MKQARNMNTIQFFTASIFIIFRENLFIYFVFMVKTTQTQGYSQNSDKVFAYYNDLSLFLWIKKI